MERQSSQKVVLYQAVTLGQTPKIFIPLINIIFTSIERSWTPFTKFQQLQVISFTYTERSLTAERLK